MMCHIDLKYKISKLVGENIVGLDGIWPDKAGILVYSVLVFRFIHLAVIRGTRSRITMTTVYYWLIIGWPLSNAFLFIAKCTVIITQTTTRHLFPENKACLKFVAHFLIETIAWILQSDLDITLIFNMAASRFKKKKGGRSGRGHRVFRDTDNST